MKITKNRLSQIIKEELNELMRVPEDTYSSYEPDQDPENPIIFRHLFMAAKKAIRMAQRTGAPREVLAALDRLSEPSLSSDGGRPDVIENYMQTIEDIRSMMDLHPSVEKIIMILDAAMPDAEVAIGRNPSGPFNS